MFETSIPEEIVIVKSVLHGKRKCRKKAAETDGDSDEEARQLIDEAENEQDSESNPAAGMVVVLAHVCMCFRACFTNLCFSVNGSFYFFRIFFVISKLSFIFSTMPLSCGASGAFSDFICEISITKCPHLFVLVIYCQCFYLQCFDAVGWAAGRASGL